MIEYFWITDTELSVNGIQMTPEESYKRYPEYADEIRSFVSESKLPSNRIFNFMQGSSLREKSGKLFKIKERISQIFKQLSIKKY